MSIVSIQTRIKALIDGIASASGIGSTFAYDPTVVNTTPAVAIILDDSGEEYATSNQNSLMANFIIRVMVEKTTDDATQVALLLGIVDDILDELRKKSNQTLSGNAHSMQCPNISAVIASNKGNTNIWMVDIRCETKTLKSIL